ncbi:hypothetical protein ACFL96_10325 [Thermoproteota archaeon]
MERKQIEEALRKIGFTHYSFDLAEKRIGDVVQQAIQDKLRSQGGRGKVKSPRKLQQRIKEQRPDLCELQARSQYDFMVSGISIITKYIDRALTNNGGEEVSFIECGAGLGNLIGSLGILYKDNDIVFEGYDCNEKFLKYAMHKLSDADLEGKVILHKKSIKHIQFASANDKQYDIVACFGSLLFKNQKETKSILSMVAPDGRFILQLLGEGNTRVPVNKVESCGFECIEYDSCYKKDAEAYEITAVFKRE